MAIYPIACKEMATRRKNLYGTAQPQGNEGSQITHESLMSCTRVTRELHVSRLQLIILHSLNNINCFIVVNLL